MLAHRNIIGLSILFVAVAAASSGCNDRTFIGLDYARNDAGAGGGVDSPGQDVAAADLPDVPPDSPSVDMVAAGPSRTYVVSLMLFDQPGSSESSQFAGLFSNFFPPVLPGLVTTYSPDPMLIHVQLDDLTPGAGIGISLCDAQRREDGAFTCISGPAVTTASLDAAGHLVTDPVRLTFNVRLGDNGNVFIPMALEEFTLSGTLDPSVDNGPGQLPGALRDGRHSGQLRVADVCKVQFELAALGSLCDGVTSVNLLDLLDGPATGCGQDGSADLVACTASTDAVGHNPPVDGAYEFSGTFELRGAGPRHSPCFSPTSTSGLDDSLAPPVWPHVPPKFDNAADGCRCDPATDVDTCVVDQQLNAYNGHNAFDMYCDKDDATWTLLASCGVPTGLQATRSTSGPGHCCEP
jgi:hypothetical protein